MKKLILLFFSLFALGYIFQACDDTKTYAEMLDDEKDAIDAFIKKNGINVISEGMFEENGHTTDTAKNEYVGFSNGVYLQIRSKGGEAKTDSFKNNNMIATRYVEVGLLNNDTSCFNVYLPDFPGIDNMAGYYTYPDVFRYVDNGSSIYGVFTGGSMYMNYQTTDVPVGWLMALKYVNNNACVRMIVPSKMGNQTAQQQVIPNFYDIRKFQKTLN